MFVALPVLLLIALAAVAALALRVRPLGTAKVVLIHAFSGQLHDTGYDALAAVQAAIQQATDERGLLAGRRIQLVALDDAGTSEGALRQLEAVASDDDVLGVLCCSSSAVSLVASRQMTGVASRVQVLFPSEPAREIATSQVSTVLRLLRPSRLVLVRSGEAADGPIASAVEEQAHPAATVELDLGGGGSLDGYAARIVAANPDAVYVDADVASASLLLARLREQGYAGPAAGPESLGCSEMVTWTGTGLGTFYVPVRPRLALTAALDRGFAAARGHPPSDDDRLLYLAAASLLEARAAPSTVGAAEGVFAASALAPGQFPPRIVPVP